MLLRRIIEMSPFDNESYLEENPDIARAVQSGVWRDGKSHYAAKGYFEGRWAWFVDFSEKWYLSKYPDVERGVKERTCTSGKQHYRRMGMFEMRCPSARVSDDLDLWKHALLPEKAEKPTTTIDVAVSAPVPLEAAPVVGSTVTMPVGTLSAKGDAVLGHGGILFILGQGHDALMKQYGRPDADAADTVSAWLDVLRTRHSLAASRGIRFLQLLIPEKLSVMPEAYPAEIATPTTLLRLIEQGIAADMELRADYLSCYDVFRNDPLRVDTFRRIDPHLTPYGAYALFQQMLRFLDLAAMPAVTFDVMRVQSTDAGERFHGLVDTYPTTSYGWTIECEKRLESRTTLGHHGKRQGWTYPQAPNRTRAVVFGNSYCGFVEQQQCGLSWWMARQFAQYEFVWSSELDWDLVDELRPDLVICQSVEKFLHRVPTA